jgi:hypothetical protein
MHPSRVFTCAIFTDTGAKKIDDPAVNWPDVAGLSMFAAKPQNGHMGVMMYGFLTRSEEEDGHGQGVPGSDSGAMLGWYL